MSLSCSPIRIEDGGIGGTLVVVQPLPHARSAVEQRSSESKHQSIVMTSADAIICVDDRGKITDWNQGAEKIFGYSKEDALGTSLEKLLPEPAVGVRKNGEVVPISATISRVEVSGQRIMTVAVRDISDQKRIESEQRVLAEVGGTLASLDYESAMEALPKVVVGVLAEFARVSALDAGVLRRVGAAHVDPEISKTAVELDIGDSTWSATLTLPLLALGNCVGVMELAKSKGRFVERDLQLASEIARRIALFIENARVHAAERRATKVRDEVLSVVAHDLRNPLNAIVLQSGLLRRRGPEAERRNMGPTELIRRYAMRMNALIEDLLDVSQMDAGQMRLDRSSVPIDKLIHEAVEPYRTTLRDRGIGLEIASVEDVPGVWADSGRVIQVLDNLIGNACKVVSQGGISIGARLDGASVCVWVKDTGPGVALEDKQHVFDRFWQAERTKRASVGLGLAIVKGIVEAHAGRVWLESETGRGSTFFFTLPVATAPEPTVKREATAPPPREYQFA